MKCPEIRAGQLDGMVVGSLVSSMDRSVYCTYDDDEPSIGLIQVALDVWYLTRCLQRLDSLSGHCYTHVFRRHLLGSTFHPSDLCRQFKELINRAFVGFVSGH